MTDTSMIEEALTHHWGERCPDFDDTCPICQAWGAYDALRKVPGNVLITGQEGCDECDDCGSFDWQHYIVAIDGRVILDHMGDGHMGGNVWYGWENAVSDILTAMGHNVCIDIEQEYGA